MAEEKLSKEKQEKKAPPKVKVKLKKPHEHEGKEYPAGKVITVREDQAQRLFSWGVAEKLK